MEFYLHNKDDKKLSTSVSLATTFKIDDTNYIVYYNKQVEKSMIDIYIGTISYGDSCLVINKIDSDKQNIFLNVMKKVLAGEKPETQASDYESIIGTASIVLDSVQKIQISTSSLENLINYKKVDNVPVVDSTVQTTTSLNNDTMNQTRNRVLVNDSINNLDNMINENEERKKKKSGKEPAIRPSILILLIVVLIASAVLYFFGNSAS